MQQPDDEAPAARRRGAGRPRTSADGSVEAGERLREAMRQADLSAKKLARDLGFKDASTVRDWLNGHRGPSRPQARLLAQVLGDPAVETWWRWADDAAAGGAAPQAQEPAGDGQPPGTDGPDRDGRERTSPRRLADAPSPPEQDPAQPEEAGPVTPHAVPAAQAPPNTGAGGQPGTREERSGPSRDEAAGSLSEARPPERHGPGRSHDERDGPAPERVEDRTSGTARPAPRHGLLPVAALAVIVAGALALAGWRLAGPEPRGGSVPGRGAAADPRDAFLSLADMPQGWQTDSAAVSSGLSELTFCGVRPELARARPVGQPAFADGGGARLFQSVTSFPTAALARAAYDGLRDAADAGCAWPAESSTGVTVRNVLGDVRDLDLADDAFAASITTASSLDGSRLDDHVTVVLSGEVLSAAEYIVPPGPLDEELADGLPRLMAERLQ